MEQTPSQAQEERAEKQRLAAIETAVDSVVTRLSAMQRTFVCYYLLWSNATKAAAEAGYTYPDRQGSRLLKNKKVQAAVDQYFQAAEMSAREVVARISEQAKGEHGRYLYAKGREIHLDIQRLLDDGKGHLIKSVDYAGKDATVQTFEFYGADAALDRLARMHGLYKDRLDLTTKEKEIKPGATAEELAQLLAQARQELAKWEPEADTADD